MAEVRATTRRTLADGRAGLINGIADGGFVAAELLPGNHGHHGDDNDSNGSLHEVGHDLFLLASFRPVFHPGRGFPRRLIRPPALFSHGLSGALLQCYG